MSIRIRARDLCTLSTRVLKPCDRVLPSDHYVRIPTSVLASNDDNAAHSNLYTMVYCDRCDRYFPHMRALENHERDSAQHNICDECGIDFSTWVGLKEHYVQSPRHHYCQYCNEHFSSDKGYLDHLDSFHWACIQHRRVRVSSRMRTTRLIDARSLTSHRSSATNMASRSIIDSTLITSTVNCARITARKPVICGPMPNLTTTPVLNVIRYVA